MYEAMQADMESELARLFRAAGFEPRTWDADGPSEVPEVVAILTKLMVAVGEHSRGCIIGAL